jgi:hypothetical protein
MLTATQGSPDVLAVGRSLAALHASGVITDKFLDGVLEAARKRAAALSVAPLVPYLESGTKVAIIGGAVVILTAAPPASP